MFNRRAWLRDEITAWLDKGLVDSDTADALKARYSEDTTGWTRHLLTAIGALVVGLGVILFFAYNWDVIPKLFKLAMVFTGLLAAHLTAWFLSRSEQSKRMPVEGFYFLGTVLFGAGIWLISPDLPYR